VVALDFSGEDCMSANAFNKGDVVVLKSGGPPMTIDQVPGEMASKTATEPRTAYRLEWFKGATPVSGTYPEHLLKKYEAPARK
jgi:uncharacterized protein YodC (DUF2158 family)